MTWIPPEVSMDIKESKSTGWTPPEVKKKEDSGASSSSESLASQSVVTPTVSDADNIASTLKKVPLSFLFPHADKNVLDKSRHPLDIMGKTADDEMVNEKLPEQENEAIAKDIKPQLDPSYFWGGVRAINSGTANFFKTLDNASRFVADVTGLPQHEGIFKKVEERLNEINQTTPDTPDNRVGRLIRNVGGLEGMFLELAITPGFKLAKIGAVPKIITQMTGAGFVNSYADALSKDKPTVEKTIEGLKGAGVGLKDAAILTALGYGSSLAGRAVSKATGSAITGDAAAILSNAVGFAGSDAVQQLVTTGKIDTKSVEQNFDIGLALGIPEIAKNIGTRAMANYFSSSKYAERKSLESKSTPEELRTESIATRQDSKQDDPETRTAKETQADVIDGIADIKVVSKEVAKDPDRFKESIRNDETLSAEQKSAFIDKIDETVRINAEVDKSILEAQKRLKLPEEPELRVSEETTKVLDNIDSNKPILNDDIQKASTDLYDTYNGLQSLKESDKREYTIDQINKAQEYVGGEITKLEEYAAKQKETGMFVPEIKQEEAKIKRKQEIEQRISDIDNRKKDIDTQSLEADEQTKKKLDKEFVSLNKERKQLNDELAIIEIKPTEAISEAVEPLSEQKGTSTPSVEESILKQSKTEEIAAEPTVKYTDVTDKVGRKIYETEEAAKADYEQKKIKEHNETFEEFLQRKHCVGIKPKNFSLK